MEKRKKIILTIIDSFHPKALKNCFKGNLVPALSFLRERGFFRDDCVSVFPTMTPTASSSIVTGKFADIHKVPGFMWFNRKEKRFINYGASFKSIWRLGFYQVIQDLIFNLNKRQLSKKTKTIFEILEEVGLSTAAINFFIYRGKNPFAVKVPWVVKWFTRFKFIEGLLGPKILFFGEICRPAKLFAKKDLQLPIGPFNKFGVNDDFSGIVTSQIIKEGLQPHFMLMYLPDTDGFAHRHKPCQSEESLLKADLQLQRILNSYGSWEEALEQNIFIVVGDHSQSLIHTDRDFAIDLPELLSDFSQATLGKKMLLKRDIAICPNERMAHIYLLKKKSKNLPRLLETLRREKRLDQILWKEFNRGESIYYVRKGGSKAVLKFWRNGSYVDTFGARWGFKGDLKVVDGEVRGNTIEFGAYPDAFTRISTTLDCDEAGEIIVLAKLGFEISGEATALHPGCGSHGSLHREDSLVPLVVAGSQKFNGIRRITDIFPAVLEYFRVYPYKVDTF